MSIFRSKKHRGLVLGCGPAGMFATHALVESGWDVVVMSKKRRSHMFGAQYLHMPIPGLPERPFEVDYQLRGTADEYARKVYDGHAVPFTSPERLLGLRRAWDIRSPYIVAYDWYSSLIVDTGPIGHEYVKTYVDLKAYDLVLSTMPATVLCGNPYHAFESQEIYAIGDAPERSSYAPYVCPDNTVVCNGNPSPAWYRAARILGYATMEWPGNKKPPIKEVSKVTKPIGTNCDCFKDKGKWYRLGRYGTWTKGKLSHEAYYDTLEILQSR